MNMGAGRVVYQDLTRIDKSIRDGDLLDESRRCRRDGSRAPTATHALHLIGLVSDGGVHSHQRHLHALIEMAARRRCRACSCTPSPTDATRRRPAACATWPRSSDVMAITARPLGRVATVVGPLLRDGSRQALGAHQARLRRDRPARPTDGVVTARAVERPYAAGVTDEFIKPVVIVDADGAPSARFATTTRSSFFNFRADRARQITRAIALRRVRRLRAAGAPHVSRDDDDGLRPDVQPAGRLHAADVQRTTSPDVLAEHAARPTCGSPRPRSTRTSPISSTADAKSRTRARIASSCRRRRWRPTT